MVTRKTQILLVSAGKQQLAIFIIDHIKMYWVRLMQYIHWYFLLDLVTVFCTHLWILDRQLDKRRRKFGLSELVLDIFHSFFLHFKDLIEID